LQLKKLPHRASTRTENEAAARALAGPEKLELCSRGE
jgi:hypothetical protein